MSFKNKVVLITGKFAVKQQIHLSLGSSSGVGQSTALHFAINGAKVTIHGQNLELCGSLEDDRVLELLINETVEKFGRLDVLVNNAGIYEKPGDLDQTSIATFDYVMTVNLRAPVILTQRSIPHLIKSKGSIVNVSSVLAHKPTFCAHFYSTSKAALEHYTKCMSLEMANTGVRVNCVQLGCMNTPFLGPVRSAMPIDLMSAYENHLVFNTPLKRKGEGREVAEIIGFLASESASFMTGAIVPVDGGFTSGIVMPNDYSELVSKYTT
ncbi:hypothetical protein M3Y94_01027900 [Aphelenchoides besseyi]|nr:hypothetical protein M3Y94_01027900 [Aphelenchoides besseyi]